MKISSITFHKNPFSVNRPDNMRTDRQTDLLKLIGAFREYANAPEGSRYIYIYI